jgi:hypothetical protein
VDGGCYGGSGGGECLSFEFFLGTIVMDLGLGMG